MEELSPGRRSSLSLFIIIILLVLAVVFGWRFIGGKSESNLFGGDLNGYQAVFLTNDQVYFGKLTPTSADYVALTDIFYLRVSQPLQPSPPAGGPNPNVNLVKLGSELHGPADRMEINREHILFIENLRPDSEVVKGIERYKAGEN